MTNKERVLNKATLIRLYWDKGLSTHKIARLFNRTPQMVRYLAIKYRIKLRKPKSLQPKIYNISRELLENLYIKQKLSIPQIAAKLDIKSYSTIALKLMQFDIPIRTMSEAKTKYPKKSFSGNLNEKAYMLGLRCGDLSANMNWFQIRISTSTTHPAQVEMMREIFEKYTHVHEYIHEDKRNIKEYHVYCDLDKSFDFLLNKIKEIPQWILKDDTLFYSFLVGYSDCEANWNVSKRYVNSIQIEFNLRTSDINILKQIHLKLISKEFNSKFRLYVKHGKKATYGTYTKNMYSAKINKKQDVIKLAKILLPLSKHKEKIDRIKIITELKQDTKWSEIESKVLNLRRKIKESRMR